MKYVGMDIHHKTTTYCMLDDEGKVIMRGKVQSDESGRHKLISAYPLDQLSVVLETGNMTWWVVAVLRDAGIEPVVVDALRGGLAQRYSVHVPSERARRGRALLRTRHQVVKQSVAS